MAQTLPAGHLYGEILRREKIGGVLLTETRYPAGLAVPPHSHEEAGLCFVLRGFFDRQFSFGERSCTPDTLSFHPAGERHAETFRRAGATLFSIQLASDWLARFSDGGVIFNDSLTIRDGVIARLSRQLYDELRVGDELSALSAEGLLLELGVQITRSDHDRATDPGWLSEIHQLLHDRFRESISLSDVATTVGVHPSHVARVFRRRYRCSIGDYVRRLRIDYVRRQLVDSDDSLADLALAAGFSSQAHMSSVFRRLERSTPSEYRRLRRSTHRA